MAKQTWGFDEAAKRLHNMPQLMKANMNRATKRNASATRDAIKRTIRNGRPDWPPNSPLTVGYKKSSKPLIDDGDLMNAVNYKTISPFLFFIGVPRTEKNKDGVPMANIAAVHEFGATIRPKNARMLAIPVSKEAARMARQHGGCRNIPGLFHPKGSKVLAFSKGGALQVMFILLEQVVIPPRAFISTTFEDQKLRIQGRWSRAANDALWGRRYVA